MTNVLVDKLPLGFSSNLKLLVDLVKNEEKLRVLFSTMLMVADTEDGRAVIIARAAEIGAPITEEDVAVLLRYSKEGPVSDDALDAVGGGNNLFRYRGPYYPWS